MHNYILYHLYLIEFTATVFNAATIVVLSAHFSDVSEMEHQRKTLLNSHRQLFWWQT